MILRGSKAFRPACFALLLLFQLAAYGAEADSPRIECNRAMLDRARQRIAAKAEPFYSYWQLARADAEKVLSLEATPCFDPDPLVFHMSVQEQGIAARLLAYWWRLEDREDAGAKAVELLDGWAGATPLPGTTFDPEIRFPNAGMDVARGLLPFVAAYDLLDGHPALTADKRERIEAWFRVLAGIVKEGIRRWEDNDDFGNQEFQNHHASHVLGLVLFGAALHDDAMIQFAVDSPDNPKDYKELVAGLILMPGDEPHGGLRGRRVYSGEIQDRYRTRSGKGLTYCHLSLTLMLYTADVLTRVTGEDYINWKAPGGECLRMSAVFYSDFFRLRDTNLRDGYYAGDGRALARPHAYLGIFEVALGHWPDEPKLKAIVRTMSRAQTPRHWLCYYGLPLLTHGVEDSNVRRAGRNSGEIGD
jgi:hypothetical protein